MARDKKNLWNSIPRLLVLEKQRRLETLNSRKNAFAINFGHFGKFTESLNTPKIFERLFIIIFCIIFRVYCVFSGNESVYLCFWKKNSSSADLPLNKDNEIKWFFGAKRKVCCESESRFGRRGAEMSKADSIKCECDCDRTLFWPKRARATHAFANCLNLSLDSKLTRLSFFFLASKSTFCNRIFNLKI